MPETKLKPCPFCGGEATLIVDSYIKATRIIVCRKCGSRCTIFRTEEEAIAAWNKWAEEKENCAAE